MAVMWNEKKVKDKRNQWEGAESADALHCSTFVMAGSAWMGIAFIGNSSNMLSSICLLFKFELPSPVLLMSAISRGNAPSGPVCCWQGKLSYLPQHINNRPVNPLWPVLLGCR